MPFDNYNCPTCGLHDPYAYISCTHPNCPDGRDPPARVTAYNTRAPKPPSDVQRTLFAAAIGVVIGASFTLFAIAVRHL